MRITVLGGKARISFLKELCDFYDSEDFSIKNSDLEKEGVLVKSIDQKLNTISKQKTFFSKEIPLNTELFFAPLMSTKNNNSFDKILFIDEFPFRTKEDCEQVYKYKNKHITVLIHDINRRGLYTDIDNIQEAIIEAKKAYERDDIPVVLYKKGDNLVNVLKSSYQYTLPFKDDYAEKMRNLVINIKELWNLDFDMAYITKKEAEITNPALLNSFICYTPKMDKNIYKDFSQKVIDYFIKSRFNDSFSFAIDLYMANISEILFWDYEKEKDYVRLKVKDYFINEFRPVKKLLFQGNENDFIRFMNVHQEDDLMMKKSIESFFHVKLSEYLYNFLLERIRVISKQLNYEDMI